LDNSFLITCQMRVTSDIINMWILHSINKVFDWRGIPGWTYSDFVYKLRWISNKFYWVRNADIHPFMYNCQLLNPLKFLNVIVMISKILSFQLRVT